MKKVSDPKFAFAIFDVFNELVCITDDSCKMIYANPALRAYYTSPLKEDTLDFP